MKTRGLFCLVIVSLVNNHMLAQGYGDVEVRTVTTAPVLIDCGTPPAPKAIQWPTLPPIKSIQFPTFAPPTIPSFTNSFPTASYAVGPPTTTQGYNQAPPQSFTFAPLPRIPTFNELFHPIASAQPESYTQPKIDYLPSTPSTYQTAPQPFTFAPLPKMPTFADLFPSAPIAPSKPIVNSYEVGPPSVKPEEPYSSNVEDDKNDENAENNDNMEGDEILLHPAQHVENKPVENKPVEDEPTIISPDQPLQINAMPIKTAKFESTKIVVQKPVPPSAQKVKKMIERKHKVNGVKTFKEMQIGSNHHVDAHNHHTQNPHRKI